MANVMKSYRQFRAATIYFLTAMSVTLLSGIALSPPLSPPNVGSIEFDDYSVASGDERDMPPRLIGLGCKGAGGPLWADEEDEFPRPCKEIHVIPLYGGP